MLILAEALWHATCAIEPLFECNTLKVALKIEGPGVIDALEALGRTATVQADQRAAMAATILERVDLAILGARHNDRSRADEAGPVVAGLRHLGLQTKVVPGTALVDALLLLRLNTLVLVDGVWHPGVAG